VVLVQPDFCDWAISGLRVWMPSKDLTLASLSRWGPS
jgi:hypothetical protein